jgi:hypothetical protein
VRADDDEIGFQVGSELHDLVRGGAESEVAHDVDGRLRRTAFAARRGAFAAVPFRAESLRATSQRSARTRRTAHTTKGCTQQRPCRVLTPYAGESFTDKGSRRGLSETRTRCA